jgi:hypothetical protein
MKAFMKGFALLIIPLIHGTRIELRVGGEIWWCECNSSRPLSEY